MDLKLAIAGDFCWIFDGDLKQVHQGPAYGVAWQWKRLRKGKVLTFVRGSDIVMIDPDGQTNVFDLGNVIAHDAQMHKDRLYIVCKHLNAVMSYHDGVFEHHWRPSFITGHGDRCHLNGLSQDLKYVTMLAKTDTPGGWRDLDYSRSGLLLSTEGKGVIALDLCMPHAPRVYQNKIWLSNSGKGEFGYISRGEFVPIVELPGFPRGAVFAGDRAIIAVSRPRWEWMQTTGIMLPLHQRLLGQQTQAGLYTVSLKTGKILDTYMFPNYVKEIFDLEIL